MARSLNSIVAVSQNMGIGKDGRLPWPPLRNEYKYFQRMTSTSRVEGKQNAVIMGKKTWFSIPEKNRPLKDRINIVLSRELKETPKGAHYLSKSLDDALALLDSPELQSKVDMVWIVGGTSVYKAAMEKPIHHRLFVTRILKEFESDTFFPEIDHKDYKLLTELHPTGTEEQQKFRHLPQEPGRTRPVLLLRLLFWPSTGYRPAGEEIESMRSETLLRGPRNGLAGSREGQAGAGKKDAGQTRWVGRMSHLLQLQSIVNYSVLI
ncbi:dihydrofolate reductase isoform X1 [Vidua macroura]|uniref:dihydrofolate reductase isoform X1 n=2 Tax=Vidua macroura TaxID=187451 RepID=UPI0023A8936D|nr:dihydrofolate reductase isoform X1 [Vidua macroura]